MMIEISCDFMYFRSEAHVIVWNGKDNLAFDSGTGKTFLFRELLGLDSQHRLYSNKHLIMSDDVRVLSTMSYTSDDCVIIDEANLKPHHLYDLFCKIRDANAYIIVMGRLLIAQLEYAVNSIYEFELDVDREFSIINHVYLNEAFQNSTRKSVQNDIVVCEDSRSVADIYSNTLGIGVTAAYGRSKFYGIVKSFRSPLLIVDLPKFGTDLIQLIHNLGQDATEVANVCLTLFCPDCFEQILCEVAEYYDEKLPDLNVGDFFDREFFYERKAKGIQQWSKSNVGRSLNSIQKVWDFCVSNTLQELCNLIRNGTVGNIPYYEINLDEFIREHKSLLEIDHAEKSSIF